MINLDPKTISERDNYKFLIGSIIPRPIALVTTQSADGTVNIAPFSYFNIVTSNPPIVSVALQRKNGELKDTTRNILESKEAVIHIVDGDNVNDTNQTAANLDADVSELTVSQFSLVDSVKVKTPGLKESKVRLEVSLFDNVEIIDQGQVTANLLLLKVEQYHIEDSIYSEGRIDPRGLDPQSRLAGFDYASLGDIQTIVRPQ